MALPKTLVVAALVLILLGGAVAALVTAVGTSRIREAGAITERTLFDIGNVAGALATLAFGIVILRRQPLTRSRWWFVAAWVMGIGKPLGLIFFIVLVATTVLIRSKHWTVFQPTATRLS